MSSEVSPIVSKPVEDTKYCMIGPFIQNNILSELMDFGQMLNVLEGQFLSKQAYEDQNVNAFKSETISDVSAMLNELPDVAVKNTRSITYKENSGEILSSSFPVSSHEDLGFSEDEQTDLMTCCDYQFQANAISGSDYSICYEAFAFSEVHREAASVVPNQIGANDVSSVGLDRSPFVDPTDFFAINARSDKFVARLKRKTDQSLQAGLSVTDIPDIPLADAADASPAPSVQALKESTNLTFQHIISRQPSFVSIAIIVAEQAVSIRTSIKNNLVDLSDAEFRARANEIARSYGYEFAEGPSAYLVEKNNKQRTDR